MAWDSHIRYGMGQARGVGVTGFHPHNGGSAFTGLLFRGDTRAPGIVFGAGFQLHRAGVQVAGRTTSAVPSVETTLGTTRGVVSASKDLAIGIYWAAYNAASAWVYSIYIEDEAWAASAMFNLAGTGGAPAANLQQEIMLNGIAPGQIVAARPVTRGGPGAGNAMGTTMYMNSRYTGTLMANVAGMNNDPQYQAFTAGVTAVTQI